MTTTHPKATEADLLNAPKDGRKYELKDGEVVMSPAGSRHGAVCTRLIIRLGTFIEQGRIDGFSPVAPDLAVKVLSPDDRPRYVLDKVGEYLDAGVSLVWVVDPKSRTATVYRSLTNVRTVAESGNFDGENILPGFRCSLADILAE